MSLLLRDVEVDGGLTDVRVHDDRVVAVEPDLRPEPGEDAVAAGGAALLPGLHDHHLHLLAAAAAAASVPCGPPSVPDAAALREVLRAAAEGSPPGAWVRGVDYDDSVAGALDRRTLDEMVADRPVRVQHRSGALWMLNSMAMHETRLARTAHPDVERDARGEATGRLWRFDVRLRDRLPSTDAPDVQAFAQRLNGYGITGITDATPDLDATAVALFAPLPLDVLALGASADDPLPANVMAGPQKLLLRDHDLPALDDLTTTIARAHAAGRPVAVHCVTRESLVLTVLALEAAGPLGGDRIEHAGVVPPEFTARMTALGVAVVTQPSFVALRGDDYLREVAADDLGHLYPYASLLAAGLPVAPSSDAPYGDPDPWRTMIAARDRSSPLGAAVAEHERVDTLTALRGFLSPPLQPGGTPRRVQPDAVADLCLLDAPLKDVLAEPDADRVRLVLRRGDVVFAQGPGSRRT